MRNLIATLIAFALLSAPVFGQAIAHDTSTEKSWVIREPTMPFLRATMPADGVSTTPRGMSASPRDYVHKLRVKKAERVWATYAPWSYDPDLVEFFISECEKWGIGDQWLYLLTYGMANFGLRVNATAPGRCYGPFDCKWPYVSRAHAAHVLEGPWDESALRDPYVNTACHVGQSAEYHRRTGRTGMALLRTVFYPAAPYGRACNAWAPRWDMWYNRFTKSIKRGYKVGKLHD